MSTKIPIVEDDADIVRTLAVRLRPEGYTLIVATDAVGAVSTARKELPALVLVDLGLPAGGGFVVMKRLKALPEFALVPMIVVSARDRKANEPLAREADAYAYLQKPVDAKELLALMREALEAARGEAHA